MNVSYDRVYKSPTVTSHVYEVSTNAFRGEIPSHVVVLEKQSM